MKSRLIKLKTKLHAMLKKRWKLILVLLLIIGGGAFFYFQKQQAAKPEITTTNPERKTLVKTLDVSGIVDAKEKANLRFLAGGKITYLGAKEGSPVKKWQTIATIDQTTLQKQFEQNMNNYLKERWDWEQTRDDKVENSDGTNRAQPELSIRRTVDQAQWDLENSVLTVEINDIAIQNTRMTSPIEGILVSAPTTVTGVQLTAADAFVVVNPNTLVFKAAVDEVDIASVKLAQSAEIELDAYQDKFIPSSVRYIAYASNQTSTGTVFLVEFPITPENGGLDYFRLGMNGDVSIKLDEKANALVIPIQSTREKDGKTLVDIQTTDGKIEEREITTGMETDEEIEVLTGLSETDQVVVPS